MKLYTEEQMHSAMLLALGRHGIYVPNKHYQDLIDLLTPIELPSDEEIDRESEVLYPININKGGSMWMPSRYDIDKNNRQEGFFDGAKWMRDKIQGGNK